MKFNNNILHFQFLLVFFVMSSGFLMAQKIDHNPNRDSIKKMEKAFKLEKRQTIPRYYTIGMPGSERVSYTQHPLFVLNGEIVDYNLFRKLNPEVIESMTFLKNKNAEALYGEEGKYGVIIVKTKPDQEKVIESLKEVKESLENEPIIAI